MNDDWTLIPVRKTTRDILRKVKVLHNYKSYDALLLEVLNK